MYMIAQIIPIGIIIDKTPPIAKNKPIRAFQKIATNPIATSK